MTGFVCAMEQNTNDPIQHLQKEHAVTKLLMDKVDRVIRSQTKYYVSSSTQQHNVLQPMHLIHRWDQP